MKSTSVKGSGLAGCPAKQTEVPCSDNMISFLLYSIKTFCSERPVLSALRGWSTF